MSIYWYYDVQCMADLYTEKNQHVYSVQHRQQHKQVQNFTQENKVFNGIIHCIIPWEVLHSRYKNMEFNLPHVWISGTNYCGKKCRKEFKHIGYYEQVTHCCEYSEHLVASFYNQIQYELYDGNRYSCIEGIALEKICVQ